MLRASPGHPQLCTDKFRFRPWAVSSVGSAYLPISVHDLWDVLVICRIRTALGQDVLPPAARKLQFSPRRPPGAHLGPAHRSSAKRFTTARDFFFLFFTAEVIRTICENTNKYAWMHILGLLTYAEKDANVCQKKCSTTPKRCRKGKTAASAMRNAKLKKKTNVLCETCGVHLCFTKTRNCFTAWHERWSSFRSAVFLICVKNGFMQIVYFSFRIFLDHFPSKCIFWILFVRNIFVDIVFCLYCFSQVPAKVVDFRFFISFVTSFLFWNLCYL